MAVGKKLNMSYLVWVICMVLLIHRSAGEEGLEVHKKSVDSGDRALNEIKEVAVPIEYKETVTQNAEIDNEITTEKKSGHVKKSIPTAENLRVKPTLPTQTVKPVAGPSTDRKESHSTVKSTTVKPKTTPTKARADRIDSVDQYLLDGLLDIVDQKFDTLNKRLMTLERGMNNLQYYNVRSFRVVNTHLHAVDTTLHTIHSQVGQNEHQNKIFEQSVAALKNDVTDLQSMNNGMFQAIEQNLVHFHHDLDQKLSSVQEGVEGVNVQINQLTNDSAELKANVYIIEKEQQLVKNNLETSVLLVSEILQKSSQCINKTTDIYDATVDIDMRTKMIEDTVVQLAENVSKLSTEAVEIKHGLSTALTNISVAKVEQDQFDSGEDELIDNMNYKEFRVTNSQIQMSCGKMLEILDEKLKHINVTLTEGQHRDYKCDTKAIFPVDFKNQSRKLLRALSTVNENVFQSVTLYRHTGNLIERVISDTELIATEQVRLREELVGYLLNGTFDLFNRSIPDFADVIASRSKGEDAHTNESQTCAVAKSLIDEVLKLSVNGTQLVQMLTDLTTTSSSSIQLSIDKLDKEINRLNKIQDETVLPLYQRHDAFVRDDPKSGSSSQMKEIQNKTDWIYQLSEAIASNTGWIPYVFHNLRFVENQMNKTLKLVTAIDTRSEEILIRQRSNMAIMFKPKQPPTSSPVTKAESADLNEESKKVTLESDVGCSVNASQMTVFDNMLSYVYNVNKKMNRLIPALTNLLGEPEPYISLVDGKTDREGRVEVYHKGKWGTIAGPLSNVEASYVCRKLGFLGGISAGSGHFGTGSGQFWNLNVTCLRTRWCSAVTHVTNASKYSHSQDVGVICEHMLRLTQTNEAEEQEVARQTGKLEIYHNNNWIPVCSKGWGRRETDVACRQLGFREGAATGVKDESLVDSNWMINVTCKGNENRLDACAFNSFDSVGCLDFKYVSLVCS